MSKKEQKNFLTENFLISVLIILVLFFSVQVIMICPQTYSNPIELNPGIAEIIISTSPVVLKTGETQIITGYILKSGVAQITVS